MAIIYSYPEKLTAAGGDFLVITDSEQPAPNKNRTKSLTIDNLADYVVTSTSGITGSGTLNTIAMFTPDGQKIGNSIITYDDTSTPTITIGPQPSRLQVDGDLVVANRAAFSGPYARFDTLMEVNEAIRDGYNSVGTSGQVLTSTGTDTKWVSLGSISDEVTGSGTTNTIPIWTDGSNGVLSDSIITQSSGATSITIGGGLTIEGALATGGTTIKSNSTALTLKSDTFPGGVEYTYLVFYSDPTTSSSSISTPNSGGVVEIGQGSGGFVQNLLVHGYNQIDQLRANTIRDGFGSTGSTFTGTNVLTVQNLFGQLQWEDSTDLVSGSIAKLIPTIIVASAGGSSTYSGDNNIVELQWTGGTGTYTLNVPSATAIPYRVIRFVTDGTFPGGASHKINITAQAGETIDGNPDFEISKVYEGVSIWSTGTEWIVIQAKAH